jgi:hypothetical protein
MIVAFAKGCFLMGVSQAIRVMLMQKQPAMLTEAIQEEAMSLELINKSNSAKGSEKDRQSRRT